MVITTEIAPLEIDATGVVRISIEDILLLAEYSLDDEWKGQIRYLPLR